MSDQKVFDALSAVNVNGHTEKKRSGNTELTYLSWPFAWAEVKKRYPNAEYHIVTDECKRPYFGAPEIGYMVYTTVTIDGVTHEMWLPVMDSHNAAMKGQPYEVKTKYSKYTVEAVDMFAINKTIMRCLVKNLAMFGLGLYIYAGEDLPEAEKEVAPAEPVKEEPKAPAPEPKKEPANAAPVANDPDKIELKHWRALQGACKKNGVDINAIMTRLGIKRASEMTFLQWKAEMDILCGGE